MIMSLYHWKGYIFLVFLAFCLTDSSAVNFTQCLDDVFSCANGTSQACVSRNIPDADTALSLLRTSHGKQIKNVTDSVEIATALSYHGCVYACGRGQKPFSWSVFSQEFAAWLLPYLALISQLPFGARRRIDNLMSAVLALGSPALAGYSLYMTLLNARWVNDKRFAGINYPSPKVRQSVVRVLTSLQQVPLRVYPGQSGQFESLVVLSKNDQWWDTFSAELDYSHQWSIASATSIAWVVAAYLLTVADSLTNVQDNINANGQGTGSVWLWLLPIVVGWFALSPKCHYARVLAAYERANGQVFMASPGGSAAEEVESEFGLTIGPDDLDWKVYDGNIASPDELRSPPIFNYARILSWSRAVYVTSLFYRAAWKKSNGVPAERRPGDRAQVIKYCRPHNSEYPRSGFYLPPGLLFNMVIASIMSLQLQWGTTGAAVLVVFFTPTTGFGCRSIAYLLYGTLSTIAWALLVSSNIIGDYANHQILGLSATPGSGVSDYELSERVGSTPAPSQGTPSPSTNREEERNTNANEPSPAQHADIRRTYAGTIACHVADWLRWIGKLIAIFNAIGIITNSIFQYASVYDNCYCDSSVYTWRSSAFDVITLSPSDIDSTRRVWIGALGLSLTCCAFFVSTIYLIWDSLPS